MTNLDSIFKSRVITLPTKVCLVKAMVFPVVMYGCESWTVKKAQHWSNDSFELWCWRKLLKVPWTVRRSNQSILNNWTTATEFLKDYTKWLILIVIYVPRNAVGCFDRQKNVHQEGIYDWIRGMLLETGLYTQLISLLYPPPQPSTYLLFFKIIIYNYFPVPSSFSSVQSLSRVQLFATPWMAARQASLSITNPQNPPKLMCIELVMPSSHLTLFLCI